MSEEVQNPELEAAQERIKFLENELARSQALVQIMNQRWITEVNRSLDMEVTINTMRSE
jgi:hypothetical protein